LQFWNPITGKCASRRRTRAWFMHPFIEALSFAMGRLLCRTRAELASRVWGGPLRPVQDHRTLVGPRLLDVGGNDVR
jgi:hypothetical protein